MLNKAFKWGQEAWTRALNKVDFREEGHVQSGQVGFPFVLNKAFKWGQEAWIWASYKVDFVEEGHVQSGQVGFRLLLNRALKYGQRAWVWCLSSSTLWKKGMFRVGKWASSCC